MSSELHTDWPPCAPASQTARGRASVDEELRLRPMAVRHLRSVAAIEQATSSRPWSPSTFARELEDPGSCRYVVACRQLSRRLPARLDPRVIGFAGVQARPDIAHITNVAVDPTHQRHGVGWRLLEWVLDAAADLGSAALTLEVRTSNDVARRLYQRIGFTEVGVRPGYYRFPDEDAVLMRRSLSDRVAGR